MLTTDILSLGNTFPYFLALSGNRKDWSVARFEVWMQLVRWTRRFLLRRDISGTRACLDTPSLEDPLNLVVKRRQCQQWSWMIVVMTCADGEAKAVAHNDTETIRDRRAKEGIAALSVLKQQSLWNEASTARGDGEGQMVDDGKGSEEWKGREGKERRERGEVDRHGPSVRRGVPLFPSSSLALHHQVFRLPLSTRETHCLNQLLGPCQRENLVQSHLALSYLLGTRRAPAPVPASKHLLSKVDPLQIVDCRSTFRCSGRRFATFDVGGPSCPPERHAILVCRQQDSRWQSGFGAWDSTLRLHLSAAAMRKDMLLLAPETRPKPYHDVGPHADSAFSLQRTFISVVSIFVCPLTGV
ncbi:hypothetical protein IWX90DRAFT_508005 [Phyllosticta citrichinensis]|uniref:Uncharacterized protein n=1 Tax=Phyllosticta citrichinensis TaxID=1130410 RepID=A0ABR1XLB3_9PEZI